MLALRSRWYDPASARFLSPDTIIPDYSFPQSIHRYSYVHSNPINYTDPSGHRKCGPGAVYTYPFDETCDEVQELCRRNPHHRNCEDISPGDYQPPPFSGIYLPPDCSALSGTALACRDPDPVTKLGIVGSVLSPILAPIAGWFLAGSSSAVMCWQATQASVGGGAAAEAALTACGGDCSDEVNALQEGIRGLLDAPQFQMHHIFPQAEKLQEWFASAGIDIHQFTVKLEAMTHLKGVHGSGGFVGPGNVILPGRWNQLWAAFMEESPYATAKEIYQFAGVLMDQFGLSGLPILPYR